MEKDCNNCRFEHYRADEIPCIDCGVDDRKYWKPKPMTNADRIRAMTDDELAEYLVYHRPYSTEQNCLKWLRQPAKGDA